MLEEKISPKVIERLTKYLRCLENFDPEDYVSSEELADNMQYTSAKVRKDLSNFGEFGVRGKGYQVKELYCHIEKVLGVNKTNKVIMVGIGRLGVALLSEPEFTKEGFKLVGLFDNSKEKIGNKINKLDIMDTQQLPAFVDEKKVTMAILTVPKKVAQETADYLVKSGIRAILNFAPLKLDVPPEVAVENIDLYAKLQELNYWREKKEIRR